MFFRKIDFDERLFLPTRMAGVAGITGNTARTGTAAFIAAFFMRFDPVSDAKSHYEQKYSAGNHCFHKHTP